MREIQKAKSVESAEANQWFELRIFARRLALECCDMSQL
jgi:hypothetical protein